MKRKSFIVRKVEYFKAWIIATIWWLKNKKEFDRVVEYEKPQI